MCNFFSCIATREGRVLFCESDSHEEIIDRGKLKGEVDHFVRLEFKDGELKLDMFEMLEWYERSAIDIELKVKRVFQLISPAHEECEKTIAAADEEYQKIRAPVYEEYKKTRAAADEEYEKTIALVYEEYKKTRAPAYEEYQKTRAAAYEEYKKTRAAAHEEYEKTIAPVYEEYKKTIVAALVTYTSVCMLIDGYAAAPGARVLNGLDCNDRRLEAVKNGNIRKAVCMLWQVHR